MKVFAIILSIIIIAVYVALWITQPPPFPESIGTTQWEVKTKEDLFRPPTGHWVDVDTPYARAMAAAQEKEAVPPKQEASSGGGRWVPAAPPVDNPNRMIENIPTPKVDNSNTPKEQPKTPTVYAQFTLGSTKDEVIAIQGTPTTVRPAQGYADEVWRYDYSDVTFDKNGRVKGWDNFDKNLKVSMTPKPLPTATPKTQSKPSEPTQTFTVGSTKDEVATIQGTPNSINKFSDGEEWWHYKKEPYYYGKVVFDKNGRVKSWENNNNVLQVSLTPKTKPIPKTVEQPLIIEKQTVKPVVKPPLVLKEITTTGFGSSKDAALNDAFYNAIFNAVGVRVSSEITVLNGELIRDRVTSGVKGIIPRYEVIEPFNGKRIKITAYVDVDTAEKIIK
jgi:outer membrane protein assembly factor BamE (lipoprotein component of BamABCDE complex)